MNSVRFTHANILILIVENNLNETMASPRSLVLDVDSSHLLIVPGKHPLFISSNGCETVVVLDTFLFKRLPVHC